MKKIILTLIISLTATGLYADDWMLATALLYTSPGTQTQQPTDYGYGWIKLDASKKTNVEKFEYDAKKTQKRADIKYYSSKSYHFVGIYKITVDKQIKNSKEKKEVVIYKIYAGRTAEGIQKELADDSKIWKFKQVEVIKLIDIKNELLALNAQNQSYSTIKAF